MGPTKFLIPMKGWLNVETEDSDYFEPESIRAFVEVLKTRG